MGGPLGMVVGEILGEFLGNFLYEMFLGEGKKEAGGSMAYLKQEFGKLVSGVGKYGKMFLDFVMSMLGKLGNFFKDGFTRFVEDFPTLNISKIPGVPSGLRWASNNVPALSFLKKYQDRGDHNKVNEIPNLALLTPFGMPLLLPHLKNSFFPTGELGDAAITGETVVAGSQETGLEETGTQYAVKYYDEDGNEIDALSEEAENLKKGAVNMLKGEEISSNVSASSDVSAVSTHASYEGSEAGSVVLTKPQRSDFGGGRSGASKYQQAMIMYNNQKEMLNSYQKTQVKASLAKI